MRVCRSTLSWVLIVLPLTTISAASLSAEEPKAKGDVAKAESNGKPPRPKITISKETTYITEPLRADGYVDYMAALNRRFSQGVTPENNAAVPFWQAVGPKGIDKKVRKKYFELLGIPELPEEGDYLVASSSFFRKYKGMMAADGETSESPNWEKAAKQFDRAKGSRG